MKTLTRLALLSLLAFIVGIGSVAIQSQNAYAERTPPVISPSFCDCTRFFECGSPSPMCDGRPAMMALKFLHDCVVECGWYEVGCCSTPS